MVYNPLTYWERRSAVWRGARRDDEYLPLVNFLQAYIPADGRILEIGPGDGHTYQLLKSELPGLRYEACDISGGMIEKCRAKTGLKPRKWDGVTLPYGDRAFDALLSISVWLHVRPHEIEHFIRENCRVVKRYMFVATWHNSKEKPTAGAYCFQHDYYSIFERERLEILEEHKTFRRQRRRVWVLRKEG